MIKTGVVCFSWFCLCVCF